MDKGSGKKGQGGAYSAAWKGRERAERKGKGEGKGQAEGDHRIYEHRIYGNSVKDLTLSPLAPFAIPSPDPGSQGLRPSPERLRPPVDITLIIGRCEAK